MAKKKLRIEFNEEARKYVYNTFTQDFSKKSRPEIYEKRES
jgi:hypothetical protein